VPGTPAWLHADAYRLLAKAWLQAGDRLRAFENARLAEELDTRSLETALLLSEIAPGIEGTLTDHLDALGALADARAELGDLGGAEKAVARAITLAFDHPMTRAMQEIHFMRVRNPSE
jgi:hypothetical protein